MPDEIDEILQFDPARTVKKEASGATRGEGDEIDEILKFDPARTQAPRVGGTYQPVESPLPGGSTPISTITGEPEKKYNPQSGESASNMALLKAGYVDDPIAKINIYAKSRGIPVDRYKVIDGEIVYKDDKGDWQREVSDAGYDKLRKEAIQGATNPGAILGTAGAVLGGSPGAVAGAMAGEGVRKVIGRKMLGDQPKSTFNDLVDVGVQGLVALGGEAFGKLFSGVTNKFLARKTSSLRFAGSEVKRMALTPEEHVKAAFIKDLAEQHGITLAPHQLYDKEGMTNVWKYLRKHPLTSDSIREFDDALSKSTNEAMDTFVRDIGGYEETPFTTGTRLQDASSGYIKHAEDARSTAVKPMYEMGFDEADNVEGIRVGDVTNKIDELVKEWDEGPEKKTLMNIKKRLLGSEGADGAVANETPKSPTNALTPKQNPATEASGGTDVDLSSTKSPDVSTKTDLRKIQKTLFHINDLIEGSTYESAKISPSNQKFLKNNLLDIKKGLLSQIENDAPSFIAANAEYERLSSPIANLKKSVLGELAGLKKDKTISKATEKLFSVGNMPDSVLLQRAGVAIRSEDPEAWKRAIGGYIRDTYQRLRVTEDGNVANVAGKLHKQLFGNIKQRQIMKVSLSPDQFKAFSNLMTVFKSAAIGQGKESMTQPFAMIEKDLSGELGSKTYSLLKEPKNSLIEWSIGKWNDALLRGNQTKLFDALVSKDSLKRLSELRQLKPGTKRFIDGFAVLTASVVDQTLSDKEIVSPQQRRQLEALGQNRQGASQR